MLPAKTADLAQSLLLRFLHSNMHTVLAASIYSSAVQQVWHIKGSGLPAPFPHSRAQYPQKLHALSQQHVYCTVSLSCPLHLYP